MSHRLTIVASVALPLLAGTAWAQDDTHSVGISVDGTVVEVPVDLAAQACGVSAETLLEQWAQLGTQMSTMAATTAVADATDLAPVASPEDTQKASGVAEAAPGTGADGADAMAGSSAGSAAGADAAASAGDLAPVVAAASPEASAAANPQDALGETAAPTEGTALSKAAVCEIDAQRAAELGIDVPH